MDVSLGVGACPRCGGYVKTGYDDAFCIQCGHVVAYRGDPKPVPQPRALASRPSMAKQLLDLRDMGVSTADAARIVGVGSKTAQRVYREAREAAARRIQ